jgi:hypothetical protein
MDFDFWSKKNDFLRKGQKMIVEATKMVLDAWRGIVRAMKIVFDAWRGIVRAR